MSLFFETIKIQNQQIFNIDEHNQRLNKTIYDIYHKKSFINLKQLITPPKDNKLYRCKVTYNTTIQNINFYPYNTKKIQSFKILLSDINYSYKSTNRDNINLLFQQKNDMDDILIIDKNMLLKDTSIANIALKINGIWKTPKKPLLKGTIRAYLLKKHFLQEEELKLDDIYKLESFAIMNAMIGFKIIKNPKFDLNI